MSKKTLILAPSLACLICLGAGAIPADFRLEFLKSQVSFEAAESADAAVSLPAPPEKLLDAPLAALENAQWLRVEMTHQSRVKAGTVETKLRLVRGPKDLLRSESETKVGRQTLRHLSVCDGTVIGSSTQFGAKPAEIVGERLPKDQKDARLRKLAEHATGSPHSLFRLIRDAIRNPQVEAGRWGKAEVWRVSGEIEGADSAGTHCHIYFRRDDGWPFRVEWFEASGRKLKSVATIEITGLAVDVPMSEAECKETFTFPRESGNRAAAK